MLLVIPLSIPVDGVGFQINLPSEPLLVLLAILMLCKINFRELLNSRFVRHPIFVTSACYLGWLTLSILFSSDLLVSSKYMLIECTHWWVFFIGYWFFNKLEHRSQPIWYYAIFCTLALVLVYALSRFPQYEFRLDATVLLAQPFYSDHGLLSAVMSILLLFFLFDLFVRFRKKPSFSWQKLVLIGSSLLLLVSLLGLNSRASWLSILATSIFGTIIFLFHRNHILGWSVALLVGLSTLVMLFVADQTRFEDGAQHSDAFKDRLLSSINTTTNVSNLERINRYRCAWRMFKDRPWVGFGPGTYASAYLPYQRPDEMTRISVTSTLQSDGKVHQEGRGGGAHSEYFRALSEGGLPGLLFWLGLVTTVVLASLRILRRQIHQGGYGQITGVVLGIFTFLIHGLFNDYLHSEELAVLFWGGLGMITAVDLAENKPV